MNVGICLRSGVTRGRGRERTPPPGDTIQGGDTLMKVKKIAAEFYKG